MNLSALRHYRRQLEDILRVEVSVLERALEASVVQCRERQQSADLAGEHYQRALCQGLTPNELFERSLEIEGLGDAVQQALASVDVARRRWEEKRSEAIEAARERKTLDLLEQRRMRLRMVRFRRLEQQALDEAAQTRFLRTLRAGVARDE
jgi:flagellar export protein FliJ